MRYICDPHIIPTVVPKELTDIAACAERYSTYADSLHVDIADGKFAPNTTWPLVADSQLSELDGLRERFKSSSPVSLEAHLMTQSPKELGARFARAGFVRVVGHIEAFADPVEAREAVEAWRRAGAREAGLAILIDTPLSALDGAAEACDVLLVMSIAEIGFQGKGFDDRALARVEELHAMYPDMTVAVDGGVSEATVEALVRAGANRMSVGAALSKSTDPAASFARILERAQKGCAPEGQVLSQ